MCTEVGVSTAIFKQGSGLVFAEEMCEALFNVQKLLYLHNKGQSQPLSSIVEVQAGKPVRE